MEATKRLYCCPPLTAAMSCDPSRVVGAALVVRAGFDGALYFKITSGGHDPFDLNVNEPLAFCPFYGKQLAAAPSGAQTLRIELPADEELTVLSRNPTLALAGA